MRLVTVRPPYVGIQYLVACFVLAYQKFDHVLALGASLPPPNGTTFQQLLSFLAEVAAQNEVTLAGSCILYSCYLCAPTQLQIGYFNFIPIVLFPYRR